MEVAAQIAFHGGDDVHHLGESFDLHELGGLDAAGDADAAQVVAGQVDQHRVLRLLLGVAQQLVLEQTVTDLGAAARPGARDGASGDAPRLDAYQRLGGGAGQLHAQHPQEEHVGGRVGDAEPPVDRVPAVGRRERHPPRRHALEDVSGQDVLLERGHDLAVPLVGHVRFALDLGGFVARRLHGR